MARQSLRPLSGMQLSPSLRDRSDRLLWLRRHRDADRDRKLTKVVRDHSRLAQIQGNQRQDATGPCVTILEREKFAATA